MHRPVENPIEQLRGKPAASGFTLVEIAIAMIIIGLFMATIFPLWGMYQMKHRFDLTQSNLKQVQDALKIYVHANHALPCPAAREIKRGEKGFGRPLDKCYFPKTATRLTDGDDFTGAPLTTYSAMGYNNAWTITGLVPFRSLGISDATAQDGWGNILNYAVTEELTDPYSYGQIGGAIDVVDESGQSRVVPPGSIQYVVFSSGEDGKGAITSEGVPYAACDLTLSEGENCNRDAIFLDAAFSRKIRNGVSVIDYDDLIVYQQFDDNTDRGRGLTFMFQGTCPVDFSPVDLAGGSLGVNVELLTSAPFSQMDSGSNPDPVLCYTPYYSTTLTINGTATPCPTGWTRLGYRQGGSAQDYQVCGK